LKGKSIKKENLRSEIGLNHFGFWVLSFKKSLIKENFQLENPSHQASIWYLLLHLIFRLIFSFKIQ